MMAKAKRLPGTLDFDLNPPTTSGKLHTTSGNVHSFLFSENFVSLNFWAHLDFTG